MAYHQGFRGCGSSGSSTSASSTERMRTETVMRNESYTTLSSQEVHFYDLDVQCNPEWRLKNSYTNCLMWGGPRTDSRTVHEVRTYENEGSGHRVSCFKF